MTSFSAERMWAIPRVGAPYAVSEGRLIVPVTTHDAETDESETTLWRLDPGNGEKRRFATGQISGVSVSTDRRAIAYLKKVDDHRQVHVQPVDGGEGRQVADLPLGAVGVKWLPDGRLIALATLWADHPDIEATRQHTPDPQVTGRATETAIYQHWDTYLEHVYHPVVIDPDGEEEIFDLTPGWTRFWAWPNTADPIDDLDVSPDGTTIAFCVDDSAPPHRELSWSLFLVGLDRSEPRRIDDDKPGHSRRPRFSPDGAALVYGYQEQPEYYACPTRLIRRDLATGAEETLAPGWDRSPSGWIFRPDGTLLFVAEDEGRSRLWELTDDKPEALTGEGWVSDATLFPDGQIHLVHHSLTSPPEIHRVEEGDTEAVSRFTADALGDVSLGTCRSLTFTGGRGDQIQMWLADPPDADPGAPLPLVHMIHGGPHAASGDAWHWRWNAQVLAAEGYRVAMVNFHGSTGWGDEFARSIHGAWGDLPYQDIEAATDHLIESGLAEPNRMAVTGGSYGGYLVAWIISQTDRYACAVAHAAVTNLGGMYASDITYGRPLSYGAEIWEDRQRVDRWSPAAHSAGYATPTLVVHGHRDLRVPLTQGQELYGVLVGKGVPCRLVTYSDQNHWILSRANSIHWYGEFLDWLKRWL